MIKINIGQCIECPPGIHKPLIAKRCQNHYWAYRSRISEKKKHPTSAKKIISIKKTRLLDVCLAFASTNWMEYQILNCNWVCENCGKKIIPYNNWAKISAQAHILPKSLFPSLKDVIDNHLTLGHTDCRCHQRFDHSWERASKMNIFPTAFAKIQPYLHLLSHEEMRKLPDIFTKKVA